MQDSHANQSKCSLKRLSAGATRYDSGVPEVLRDINPHFNKGTPMAIPLSISRSCFLMTILIMASYVPLRADVTLELSQPSYKVGETVFFTLTNGSKSVITLPNVIGWWHIADSDGVLVGGCVVQPTEVQLSPGQYLADYWGQRLCPDGPQVPQGDYRLWVPYRSECCPGEDLTVEEWFSVGLVPVEPVSWGRIKTAFRDD
jgi:hypothetical protein